MCDRWLFKILDLEVDICLKVHPISVQVVLFQEYIEQNYYEPGASYSREITEFTDIRQACRTPMRTDAGIQLLFEYYNQLYFFERRFFSTESSPNVFLEW